MRLLQFLILLAVVAFAPWYYIAHGQPARRALIEAHAQQLQRERSVATALSEGLPPRLEDIQRCAEALAMRQTALALAARSHAADRSQPAPADAALLATARERGCEAVVQSVLERGSDVRLAEDRRRTLDQLLRALGTAQGVALDELRLGGTAVRHGEELPLRFLTLEVKATGMPDALVAFALALLSAGVGEANGDLRALTLEPAPAAQWERRVDAFPEPPLQLSLRVDLPLAEGG